MDGKMTEMGAMDALDLMIADTNVPFCGRDLGSVVAISSLLVQRFPANWACSPHTCQGHHTRRSLFLLRAWPVALTNRSESVTEPREALPF